MGTVLVELLPRLHATYLKRFGNDSLFVALDDVYLGTSDVDHPRGDDVVNDQVDGVFCTAVAVKLTKMRQERIDVDLKGLTSVALSDAEEHELRTAFATGNVKAKVNVFPSDPKSNVAREIYIEIVGDEKERSVKNVLNAVFVVLKTFFEVSETISHIRKVMLPFAFLGNVTVGIRVEKDEQQELGISIVMYNFLGSVCGRICGFRTAAPTDEIENIGRGKQILLDALQEMNIDTYELCWNDNFAQIGLDSLKIAILEGRIQAKIRDAVLGTAFALAFSSLNELAAFLDAASQDLTEPLATSQVDASESAPSFKIPLSPQQTGLLFVCQWAPEHAIRFVESVKFRFRDFRKTDFRTALNRIVMRHSILRSFYDQVDHSQYLASATETFLHCGRLPSGPANHSSLELLPVLCTVCDESSPADVQIDFHHIAVDGKSISLIMTQIYQLYHDPSFEDLEQGLQYHHYCQSSASKGRQEDLIFWSRYLQGCADLDQLPTDKPRPIDESFRGSLLRFELGRNVDNALRRISSEFGCSHFEAFVGVLSIVVRKMFGCPKFVVGMAVDLRSPQHVETVGNFVNIVPVKVGFGQPGMGEYFDDVRANVRQCRKHGRLPFEKIVKASPTSTARLFQILVVADVFPEFESTIGDVDRCELHSEHAKYDQTWYCRGEKLGVEFADDVFDSSTIAAMVQNFFRAAVQVLQKGDVAEIGLTTFEGQNKDLQKRRLNRMDYPISTTLPYFLQRSIFIQSRSQKGINKIFFKKESFSYEDLDLESDKVAARVRKTYTTSYGQLPGNSNAAILLMRRSFDLLVAIFAAWKCSMFVFPIHQSVPNKRLDDISRLLSNPIFLATSETKGTSISGYPVVNLSDKESSQSLYRHKKPFNNCSAECLAYITSTSGSTGLPKLTCTEFDGHSNLALNYSLKFGLHDKSVVYQLVNPSFDIFFADLSKTLCHGAALVLAHDDVVDGDELRRFGVTNAYIMPAILSRCRREEFDALNGVYDLQFGGESVSPATLAKINKLPNTRAWQEFGLTEQTVYSAAQRMDQNVSCRQIGSCYRNLHMIFRDVDGQLAPKKCLQAQLCLSGKGLMRGYYGDPGQCTAKKNLGGVEFPTGDEVQTSDDGVFFIGRRDGKVKIRGMQIDLHVIEVWASRVASIQFASAVVSQQKIFLFVTVWKTSKQVGHDECVQELKSVFEENLAEYLKPYKVVLLEEMPTTATGKIDKKKLETLAEGAESTPKPSNVSSTSDGRDLEHFVVDCIRRFSDVVVDVDDDFFDAGVDSVVVMLVAQQLRKRGVVVELKAFFKLRTVRRLCGSLQAGQGRTTANAAPSSSNSERSSKLPLLKLNHVQERMLFLYRLDGAVNEIGFRMQFRHVNDSFIGRLEAVCNQVIIGNVLLRSFITRTSSVYHFSALSATECFRALRSDPAIEFDATGNLVSVVVEQSEKKEGVYLVVRMSHVICDARSLLVIGEQFSRLLNNEIVDFEAYSPSDDSDSNEGASVEDLKAIYDGFRGPNMVDIPVVFPARRGLGKAKYFRKSLELDARTTKELLQACSCSYFDLFVYTYSAAIADVFGISKFFLGTTFANRNADNWKAVGMFANTLPLPVEFLTTCSNNPNLDRLQRIKIEIELLADRQRRLALHSNTPLSTVLGILNGQGKTQQRLFDFAINQHDWATHGDQNDDQKFEVFDLDAVDPQFALTLTVTKRQSRQKNESLEINLKFEYGDHVITESDVARVFKKMEQTFSLLKAIRVDEKTNLKALVEESVAEILGIRIIDVLGSDANFFDLGGHSLLAMRLIDRLSDEIGVNIPLRTVFDNPNIGDFVVALENLTGQENVDVSEKKQTAEVEDVDLAKFDFQLSEQQLQMFYLAQLDDGCEYQLPFIQAYQNHVDVASLHAALLCTMQEQAVLRTTFQQDQQNFGVHQQVLSITECFLALQPLIVDDSEVSDVIRRLCREKIGFDVPPIRASVLVTPTRTIAFLHLHHIISDARSTQLTNACMHKFLLSTGPPVRAGFNYVDYCNEVLASKRPHQGEDLVSQSYLESLLKVFSPPKSLTALYHRSAQKLKAKHIDLPTDVVHRRAQMCSPFIAFVAIIGRAVGTLIDATNLNIAFPFANRTSKTENVCGYFLNNLVVNVDVGTTDLNALASEITDIIEMNVPFGQLLKSARRVAVNDELRLSDVYVNCRYDLEYDASDDDDLLALVPLKCHFGVEFDVDLHPEFYRVTLRTDCLAIDDVDQLLQSVEDNFFERTSIGLPNRSGNNVKFADQTHRGLKKERKCPKIIRGASHDLPSSSLSKLLEKFFTSSKSFKLTSFIETCGKELTYSEAWNVAVKLANVIRSSFFRIRGRFLKADDVIGVVGRKSVNTTVTCLAIVVAGGAYLPIDKKDLVNSKKKRLLERLVAFVAVGPDIGLDLDKHYNCIRLRDDDFRSTKLKSRQIYLFNCPTDLAYVIPTSGTTGDPKCVCVGQASVVNLCVASTNDFRMTTSDVVYQFTNFVFDNSVLETMMALCNGASLLVDDTTFDPARFAEQITTFRVTHCLLFPSLVSSFRKEQHSALANLRYWVVGGEPLPKKLLQTSLEFGVNVVQNYGPTEATAYALRRRMQLVDEPTTIGKPVHNMRVTLDVDSQLLVSGVGVMRGYLDRDNTDVFRTICAKTWYSTGDVCRFTESGNAIFGGRNDSQIKIRGFRVELAEIEGCLEGHPCVEQAKCAFDSEMQQIFAYLTPKLDVEQLDDVRRHCVQDLEEYKVPAQFISLNRFPLTSNSKIDVGSLPKQCLKSSRTSTQSQLSDLAHSLRKVWSTILNHDDIGKDDHFYLIGGHSLLLVRLRNAIEVQLGLNVSIAQLLPHLKFSQMAHYLEGIRICKNVLVFLPALYGGCTAYATLLSQLQTSTALEVVLLEDESAGSVPELGRLYAKQLKWRLLTSPAVKVTLIGASAAGALAFETSRSFADVAVVLIDAGTYFDQIARLSWDQHREDLVGNLKKFDVVDEETVDKLAESSWKTLAALSRYRPECNSNTKLFVLSTNGSDLGWSRYAAVVKVFRIDGDHTTMLDAANSDRVAQCILQTLQF